MKIEFFQKIIGQNLDWKRENFRLKTECKLCLISRRSTSMWMPYMARWAKEERKKTLALWKKIWVFHCFRQELCCEKVVHRKFRRQSVTTLPLQPSKKQADPTIAFVESVKFKNPSGQWRISKIVSKKTSKISAFLFTKTGPKTWQKKHHSTPLTWGVFNRFVQ